MKNIVIFLFLWFTPNAIQAQVVLDSVYKLLPDHPNDMHAMVVDDDTLVVVQSLYDTIYSAWGINLFKMDTLGNILSSTMLTDTLGYHHIRGLWGNKLISTVDRGYAYGASYNDNPACKQCIFFIKYKHSGEMQFVKYYQSLDTTAALYIVNNLLQSNDGYFLFCHYLKAGSGISVPHLIRTDSQGNELWSRDYPAGDTSVVFFDVLALNPNKFVITGFKQKYIPVYILEFNKPYLLVMDSLGNVVYEYTGVDSLSTTSIAVTVDGGFLQTVQKIKTFSEPVYSVVGIRKLDSNFVEQWIRYTDDTNYNDLMRYSDLIKTPDGNYVACGPRGLHGTANNTSMHIKISDTGEVIWERFDKAHWNGEEAYRNYPRAIGVLSSGSTVSVGSAFTFGGGELGWIFKISPGGCVYDTIACWPVASQEPFVQAEELVVYPNPTSDYITFSRKGDAWKRESEIFIINALGQLVAHFLPQGLDYTWSIEGMPDGLYFYRYLVGGREVDAGQILINK